MSTPSIPRDATIDALVQEWASLVDLLEQLEPDEWDSPTPLPGWAVRDVVAHLIGTEAMLAGETAPEAARDATRPPHVRNDIGEFNEQWVTVLRPEAPEVLLGRFRQLVQEREASLRSMTQEEFDAAAWTPAGQASFGRFMQIRLFDCWLHEQDIRDAVDRPGHESGPCAEGAIDEIVRALGFIVGKRAGAPPGSRITIELTGPVTRSLHVAVDERALVVPGLDTEPTAGVSLSSSLFVRLAGGRVEPADHLDQVELTGDRALAERVATNLAFTI
jgi:uncharacterized protein (TIGR03083 family)